MNREKKGPFIVGDPETARTEAVEERVDFVGEDAEVSVMRTGDEKKGIPPWKEGGWKVLEDDKRDNSRVVVGNDKGQTKPVNRAELVELQRQDFREGEQFSIAGRKWIILEDIGSGGLLVGSATEHGDQESQNKRIEKSQFIEAKIAEISKNKAALELEEKATLELDSRAADRDNLTKLSGEIADAENQLKYWQAKLNTRKQLIKESAHI